MDDPDRTTVPADEINPEKWPGLRNAYDLARSSLVNQAQTYDALVSRIQFTFGIFVAVSGIGMPLILTVAPQSTSLLGLVVLFPIALFIYGVYTALTAGLKPEGVQLLDDPKWIREQLWRLPQGRFEAEVLALIEEHHPRNEESIDRKRSYVTKLTQMVWIQTVIVSLLAIAMFTARSVLG